MEKLVFVYNADRGLFNSVTDIAHKIFSPSTYACNLCAITHKNFGMHKEWKIFIEGLDIPLEFLHRDEFKKAYNKDIALPAILKSSGKKFIVVISAETINQAVTIDDLKKLILDLNR